MNKLFLVLFFCFVLVGLLFGCTESGTSVSGAKDTKVSGGTVSGAGTKNFCGHPAPFDMYLKMNYNAKKPVSSPNDCVGQYIEGWIKSDSTGKVFFLNNYLCSSSSGKNTVLTMYADSSDNFLLITSNPSTGKSTCVKYEPGYSRSSSSPLVYSRNDAIVEGIRFFMIGSPNILFSEDEFVYVTKNKNPDLTYMEAVDEMAKNKGDPWDYFEDVRTAYTQFEMKNMNGFDCYYYKPIENDPVSRCFSREHCMNVFSGSEGYESLVQSISYDKIDDSVFRVRNAPCTAVKDSINNKVEFNTSDYLPLEDFIRDANKYLD